MIYPTYLNGIKVSGSGVPHIELTQAEYDALSDESKNNGCIYFITDAVGGSGDFAFIGLGECYSTEEKMVGCWIDGKPLYQKSLIKASNFIYDGSFSNNIDVSSLNIENLVSGNGYYNRNIGAGSLLQYSFDGGIRPEIQTTYAFAVRLYNGNLQISISNNYLDIDRVVITIKYTKTTDTAGSGAWTPNGMPAIHYSTSEQIIGTWIDGSTIYEKTINFGAIPSRTTKEVAHNIANLGRVVDIKGVMNSDVFETIPSGENTNFRVIVTSSVVRIVSGGSWSGWNDSYITIRYTKS